METAIQVIWWIGLVGALLPTLIILKEVFLMLKVLRDIHKLAEYTRDAARGIAANLEVGNQLEELGAPMQALHQSASQLRSISAGLAQRVGQLVP